ncbi:porin [Hydrogenophaga sp. BPS33]|uniref:porin n=1 Tax=Hydrogenophaga sp. BPS33 TaxID=2651974 RepID=UPI00135AA0C3|nr:porin [Hydrogenophaga sp. BPS33]
MKKTLSTFAVSATFCAAAAAQSSVTLFGVVDLNLRAVDNARAGSLTTVSSSGMGSSVLGFRGTEDLGGGLQASFWIETGFFPDTGASASATKFWNRRTTLGLKSTRWGELRMGRDYTATFWNMPTYDPFSTNGVGASFNILPTPNIVPVATLTRADNMLAYYLPGNLGGVDGMLQYAFGEGDDDNKYAGGRLGYAAGPLSTAIAYGKTWTRTSTHVHLTDWGASWKFSAATLMGQIIHVRYGRYARTNYLVGATIPVGANAIRVSYLTSRFKGPTAIADDAQQFAIGYVHNLSRRTVLYTTASVLSNGRNGRFVLPSGPAVTAAHNGLQSKGVEFGMRHTF